MKDLTLLTRARQAWNKLKGSIVQECPPELQACQSCGELECDNERWLHCETRLAFAERLTSGRKDLPPGDCPNKNLEPK